MRVKELIKNLQKFDENAFVYLNTECNIEDEFLVVRADTDNILLVPAHNYDTLSKQQEFSFYIN
jgi:hypothetical protein